MASYELNLREYWRVIRRQRLVVISTTILLGVFTYIFATVNKPVPIYVATSSIKIENPMPISMMYSQAAYWTRYTDLQTHTAEIKSYHILELVAKALGKIDSTLTLEQVRSDERAVYQIERLRKMIETEQEGYTNIIHIKVRSLDPDEAEQVANAVARIYKEENKRRKNAQYYQTKALIENQLKRARKELEELEKKVSRFREQYRILDPQITIQNIFNQIQEVDQKYDETLRILQKIKQIKARIQNDRNYVFSSALKVELIDVKGPLVEIKDEIDQLKSRRDEMLRLLTPEDIKVKSITIQIDNKVEQFIEEVYNQEKLLQLTAKSLLKKKEELNKRYNEMPSISVQLEKMERELKVKSDLVAQLELAQQQSKLKEAELVDNIQILRSAFRPKQPINPPKTGTTTAAGVVIGLVLGVVLAFVVETFDTSISAVEELQALMGVDVIGVIPFFDQEEIEEKILQKKEEQKKPIPSPELLKMEANLFSHFQPHSSIAEVYRSLRTNVRFACEREGYKTLMVTSSQAKEGKTTTVVNLAISMAQAHVKTLLVETDLRRPKVHKMFGLEREPGITDVMLQRIDPQEVIRSWTDILLGSLDTDDILDSQGLENLHILTAGTRQSNTAEILSFSYFDEIVDKLRDEYDMIIFDSAPLLQASDSIILGNKVDATILLYRAGKVPRGALRRARQQLETLNSELIGIVLNGLRPETSQEYADYGYKYYGYEAYSEVEGETQEISFSELSLNEKVTYILKTPVRILRRKKLERLRQQSIGEEEEEEGEEPDFFENDFKESRLRKIVRRVVYMMITLSVLGLGFAYLQNKGIVKVFQKSKPEIEELGQNSQETPAGEDSAVADIPSGITPDMSTSDENYISSGVSSSEGNQAQENNQSIQLGNIIPGSNLSNRILVRNYPYSILVEIYTSKDALKRAVLDLRSRGIPSFGGIRNTENGFQYYLCIRNFSSREKAVEYIQKLPMDLRNKAPRIISLPYSILLFTGANYLEAINYLKQLKDELKIFTYILNNQVFYSAFENLDSATRILNEQLSESRDLSLSRK